jgi:C4-dicarboxylate-specific signal transduction histidine kinase
LVLMKTEEHPEAGIRPDGGERADGERSAMRRRSRFLMVEVLVAVMVLLTLVFSGFWAFLGMRTYPHIFLESLSSRPETRVLVSLCLMFLDAVVLVVYGMWRRTRKEEEGLRVAMEKQQMLSIRSDRLRSLGEMAAAISHELSQPLVGVRGLAEHVELALEKGWDISKEKVREKVKLIVEQGDRMEHIIRHVRLFASEAGKKETFAVSVNDVVTAGIGMVGEQFKSRGIALECDLAVDLPPVLANAFSLEEVLVNLLLNARDAVEDAGAGSDRDVTVRTRLERRNGSPTVAVEVADTGSGISEETRDKLFLPFFTTKEAGKGTGLGLAISRTIMEGVNGTIDLEPRDGGGAVATMRLPAMRESGEEDGDG